MKTEELNASHEHVNAVPLGAVVSVCMITYNHAAFIAQAIESVLMQKTAFPFELCIGEDGSSDGTRDICLKYAEKYPNQIRLFLRDKADKIFYNGKPTGKKNGILTRAACRGKYIAMLEGDDFWIDERKLQMQYELMESAPDVGICCTRAIKRFTKSDVDQVYPVYRSEGVPQSSFFFLRTNIATASLLYRRSFERREFTLNPQVLLGDWALLVSLTEDGKNCAMLPVVTAVYRKHDGGFWTGCAIESSDKLRISIQAAEAYLRMNPADTVKPLERSVRQLKRKLKLSEAGVCGFRRPLSIIRIVGLYETAIFYFQLIHERIQISVLKR